MTQQELDRRIGMPNIDQEWAQFEKEVIGTEKRKQVPFWRIGTRKAAAIAGIIFLLGGTGIATAVIASYPDSKMAALFAPDDDPIYDVVDEMPSYATGLDAMWQHLIQGLHYPQIVEDCTVYGRVVVQFVVEKDGRCTQFKVLKEATTHRKPIKRNVQATGTPKDRDYITMEEYEAAQKACHDEALRVLKSMGKWNPGKIKGEAVRSHFIIPVTFRLN